MSAATLAIDSQPLLRLTLALGELVALGVLPQGERRMAKISGGTFEGTRLRGSVEAGSVDWQLLRADGALEIDATYVLRETGGASIKVSNQGLRHGPPDVLAALARGEAVDPARYFFRTFMRFETGAPEFAWLNRTLAVATGARDGAHVVFTVFALQ